MNRPSKAAAQAAAERAAAAEKDELHSALREELRGYEQRGLAERADAVKAQIAGLGFTPLADDEQPAVPSDEQPAVPSDEQQAVPSEKQPPAPKTGKPAVKA